MLGQPLRSHQASQVSRHFADEGVKEDTLYTGMEIGFSVNEVEFILSVVKEQTRRAIYG